MTHQQRNGFTVIELLVVIGIVTTLMGIALPAIVRVRAHSRRASCASNLRQIGMALHQYHDERKGLPPGFRMEPDSQPYFSWMGRILPFVDQGDLWRLAQTEYANNPKFFGPPRHSTGAKPVVLFVCPSDGRLSGAVPEGYEVAFTHYLGVSGLHHGYDDGMLFRQSRVQLSDVRDGTSHTIMVGERPPSPDSRWGWWYAGMGQEGDASADLVLGVRETRRTYRTPTCPRTPNHFTPGDRENICDIFHFWSSHLGGGGHFLFADGSVRFLTYSADAVLPELSTHAGNDLVPPLD